MNTLEQNNILAKDYIDKLIFEKNLRIKNVFFDKSLDLMLVILNNRGVIKAKISDFPRLKNATEKQLNNWELIGNGIGLHWEDLDEDISLKGLLRDYALNKTMELITSNIFAI